MITIVDKTDCCGCSACKNVCPQKCIALSFDKEGFCYPQIKEGECVDCGLCETVCPVNHSPQQAENIGVYAIKNKRENIRLTSSSGGVFSLLAKQVVDAGGIVFGAVMEGSKVIHTGITDEENLPRLRGSKYVQSEIGNTFEQAKSYLDSGKSVLFSGTPCQISGLVSFLKKPYENLLLVDCICMGVPSPMIWGKYIAFLEKEHGAKASKIIFRDKAKGWKNYNLHIDFENGNSHEKSHKEDLFLKGFEKRLFLRPSCHACEFKSFKTLSDITLGDYWGVHTLFDDFDDDKGVSLVLTHTKRGENKLKSIQDSIIIREAPLEHAISTHRSMMMSIEPNSKREAFFLQEKQTKNIIAVLMQYTKDNFVEKTKRLAGGILRKMRLRR